MVTDHIIKRGLVRGRKGVFRVECSCKQLRIDASPRNLAARRRQDRRLNEHLAAHGQHALIAAQAVEGAP